MREILGQLRAESKIVRYINRMRERTRMFVGSSTEGLAVARAIQIELDHECEVTLWSQGAFGLGEGTLETLVRLAHSFDFAVLVLSGDDLVEARGSKTQAPRDNVLFELGLFMGGIGRDRTFVVHNRTENIKLPSDLAGVTTATFEPRSDGNLQAALGAVCGRIIQVLHTLGRRPTSTASVTSANAPRTLSVPPAILVTGGRDGNAQKAIDAAYEFGRLVSEREVRLISGVAAGVDEAFCRGAVDTLAGIGRDPKRFLTCYTNKGVLPIHRFGKIIESQYRSREEGVPELVSECDIAVLFGGGKNTHHLGIVTLLESRILVPAAATGGAAADLYTYTVSRFDSVFGGRVDKALFSDLADLNSTALDVARASIRIVDTLIKSSKP